MNNASRTQEAGTETSPHHTINMRNSYIYPPSPSSSAVIIPFHPAAQLTLDLRLQPTNWPMMKISLVPALLFLPSAYSWGTLGHTTVAYIATNFVQPETATFFQQILSDTSSDYLASVATWADSFRYTSAGRFSAPFHFIDAIDSPPTSCGVQYSRDCGAKGCSIAAIANYTGRLLDPSISATEKDIAAKFIIHIIGDTHQPLHDEAIDVGGNTISVNFGEVVTNLHHIWDTNIPEKLIGGYSLPDAQKWATTLTAAIKTGIYKNQAGEWLSGIDISDPLATSMVWAKEANAFVCTTVLPDGPDGVKGKDLSGDYYTTAVPVVQLQVAKAGYRLAAWLDLIAQGGRTEL